MKSFAVYLNKQDATCSLSEEGRIRVYSHNPRDSSWRTARDIEFTLADCSTLPEFREKITHMINELGDCRLFIAKEVNGQLFSILEAYRFSIYEVDGKPEQFLDSIYELESKELAAAAQARTEAVTGKVPEKSDEEGRYFLDLKAALNQNPHLTSKKILLPFISERNFKQLELICDHIPKWFNGELENLGLIYSADKAASGDIKVTVCPK